MKVVLPLVKTICRTWGIIILLIAVPTFFASAQAPANDNCAGNILVTSTLVNCTAPVNGTLNNATASLPQDPNATCVQWAFGYDVWYRFVAVTTTHTITTSNFGSNYWNRQIHIYSACPTAATGAGFIACGTTSVTVTTLTAGNTYYIRVSDSWSALTSGGEFTLCVTHPLTSAANNVCSSAFALTSNTSCNPTTANLRNANVSLPAAPAGPCNTGSPYDIWFRFVATSPTQTVTVNNFGSSLTAGNTFMQAFSGVCGTLTSLACQDATSRMTLTGLTTGSTYYVRVFVKTNPTAGALNTWNFDICVQGQPVNDDCLGATILTSNATCTNTAGTLDLSLTSGVGGGCFSPVGGTYYDVWYKFVAVTTTHTITLSSLGSAINNPRIQIYSGNCGTLTSINCASGTTLTQTGLTIGTVYYVRIANFSAQPYGTGGVGNFNICITHTNDDCIGSQLLTAANICNNISGTLLNANPNPSIPGCGNSNSAEVWFRFVATSTHPSIILSNIGANLNAAGPLVQLFSGTCSALTPVSGACGVSPIVIPTSSPGLLINSVYYVRVTTNSNTGVPTTGAWNFNICVTNPNEAIVDYGKSYINVTNQNGGGTVDPGDTLEIRATLVVTKPVYAGAPTRVAIDSIAYYDTLTAGKGYRLINNSIALRTNEGKLFRPSNSAYYTDAADADAAWITHGGAGTDTAVRINMGEGANYWQRRKLSNQSRPYFGGDACIVMATYRVVVNGGYGTKIKYGGGAFRYRDTITGVFYTVNFPNDSLIVFSSPAACPDAISATNIIGDESNGTFGFAGSSPTLIQSRTTTTTRYTYQPIASNGPNDYFYAVTNNTSLTGITNRIMPKSYSSPNRVFGVFDITGDHTNASNTAKGNAPCDLTQPVSPANPCGYMLAVNASFRSDAAFEYIFSGACTDTYYEISAWVKNICSMCGSDSTGKSGFNAGYIPTATGDSSGVRPNLAFEVNGIDYYSTGDILYQGIGGTAANSDTMNNWVRRSFIYKTSSTETNFKFTIRNNAPGGGGNDWALDDISIRTCFPNMVYSPSITPGVCAGSTMTIRDTVRSFYDTYKHYKWQRYNTITTNWDDIAGTTTTVTPVLIGGFYQFVATYVIPPTFTTVSNNGDRYRLMVATNVPNLANGCGYSDIIPIQITVNVCIDIDDDNDGIPDYVEFNNPLALGDHDNDGIPNWNDTNYPGFVDNNFDGVNDRFDWGADADNDGVANFIDTDFPGFVDSNGDNVNDNADQDLDGIINQYDLDSDNDGLPDVVESYGVDTNGDAIIDNYTDTDGDGFSQNVDANATGVAGSSSGLGAQDFDGDAIPNYLDTDSDNDGIPDIVEALNIDVDNNGRIDGFVDANNDGISDNDVNGTAKLITGPDLSPIDGRADNWPNKNIDRDARPNAYDMDSDGDGITDVLEAGLPDANLNGIVDGTIAINGWSTTISAMGSLNLRNTDGIGNPDYLDIDSDDDGIPDNIEGQSTVGYRLPVTTDADGDGLVNIYDNIVGFGGAGIFIYDHDGDGIPDYRDLDTDGDTQPDIVEGNDFNLNGLRDDDVTLTGLDTDGDGLDNRFDSLNSVTNIKGTSYRMGNLGSFTGDATPGSRTTVQRKFLWQTDRDWRSVGVVLPLQFLQVTATQQDTRVPLTWTIITEEEVASFEVERSIDNINYTVAGVVSRAVQLNVQQLLSYTDDITALTSSVIYYRIKAIGKSGAIKYSNIVVLRNSKQQTKLAVVPNPAYDYALVRFYTEKESMITLRLIDNTGKTVLLQQQKVARGNNTLQLNDLAKFSSGVYTIQLTVNNEVTTQKLIINK